MNTENNTKRNAFIVGKDGYLKLKELLLNEKDSWFSLENNGSVTYSNVTQLRYDSYTEDYEDDWNASVQYKRDNGDIFDSGEAEFKITQSNDYDFALAVFLVETPAGKSFYKLQDALDWVKDSITKSHG